MTADPAVTRSAVAGAAPPERAAPAPRRAERFPVWAVGGAVAVVVALVLGALALLGGSSLPDRNGPPIEQVAVERTCCGPD